MTNKHKDPVWDGAYSCHATGRRPFLVGLMRRCLSLGVLDPELWAAATNATASRAKLHQQQRTQDVDRGSRLGGRVFPQLRDYNIH